MSQPDNSYFPTFTRRLNPKRNMVIFVIEDTTKMYEYEEQIKKLINKNIESNKENSLYYILSSSAASDKEHRIYDYDSVINSKIVDKIFEVKQKKDQVNLFEVVSTIDLCFDEIRYKFNVLEIEDKKYDILDINIVFIGTGLFTDVSEKDKISKIISKIKSNNKVKTFKYFCINDTDAIGAAALGFPIIGHMEMDYYK